MLFTDFPGKCRPVPRAGQLDTAAAGRGPLVLTDVMASWPALHKWTPDYFSQHYGDHHISADRIVDGEEQYIYPSMADYIRYMLEQDEAFPYYGKTSLHLATSMKEAYEVPAGCHCWYRNYHQLHHLPQKVNFSNMYLGPARARSPLHRDIWGTSFWNALFYGEKYWIFIPPEQQHLVYDGRVDPFFPDPAQHPAYLDIEPLVCIQQPGEVIYCPGNIWHAVMVVKPSIALSENFINEENYQHVLDHFTAAGYVQALEKMQAITAEYLVRSC